MMRSLTVFILLAVAVDGQPASKAGVRMSQQHAAPVQQPSQQRFASSHYQPAAPFSFHAPQERLQMDHGYSSSAIRTRLQAEAADAPVSTPEYVNIYEEALDKCVDDDFCTYRSATMADHDICAGVRTTMAVEKSGMSWGAAPIEADCVSILSFGSKSGRLQETRGFLYIPKCSALPAGLLDSAFSMEMMKGEALKQKIYKPNYEGKGSSGIFSDGGYREMPGSQMTRATNNFRRGIETVCELCAAEAPNEKAKENLAKACASIKAVALAEQDTRENNSISQVSVFLTGLASAFVGGFATFVVVRFRSARTAIEEPFLSA